jgi:hypothetical protein
VELYCGDGLGVRVGDEFPMLPVSVCLLFMIAFSLPSSFLKSLFESSVSFTVRVVTAQALLSENVIQGVNGRLISPSLNQFIDLHMLRDVFECLPYLRGYDYPLSIFDTQPGS